LLGLELEYDVEEKGPGHAKVFLCRVKLVSLFVKHITFNLSKLTSVFTLTINNE